MQNWHFRKYSVIPSVVELLGGGNPLVDGCYVCESCQPIISTCQRRNVIPAQERHSSVGWNLFMGKWTPAYAGVTLLGWGEALLLRHASGSWHPFMKKLGPSIRWGDVSGLG